MYNLNRDTIAKSLSALSAKICTAAFLMMVLNINLNAQVNCNQVMACNSLVQISLASNCTEVINPRMVLERATLPDSDYEVITRTKTGMVLPNNLLTRNSIGITYDVTVSLKGCGVSCWGSVIVEDKISPTITNCDNLTINCGTSTDPAAIGRPSASDACGTFSLTFTDKVKISQCIDPFAKVITRTWTAIDEYNNKSTCDQRINVIRPTLSSVTFPLSYDDDAQPVLTCGEVTNLLPNGAPSPDVTGKPGGTDCPNIVSHFEDVIFPICGNSIKVLRKWNVIDWCTGDDSTHIQIIKILDREPPICTSAPDFLFRGTTDEGKCTGTFRVPEPTVNYECSSYTYTVSYKLRGPDGQPFVNAITTGVTRITNPNGSYYFTISGLPADTTWIIYTITDACGNSTKCFTEALIEDKEAPTAVCEGFTVVTLDNTGTGSVNATSIDASSNDNCSINKILVRRVNNGCGKPEDLNFSESVSFCCSDISSTNPYQQVVMRVFDHDGNFSDCTSNVKVQDKKPPVISKVPDITLDCGADFKNTSITGRPTVSDNCTVRIDSSDSGTLKCGQGVITRTWKATDSQGLTSTSTQIITLRDATPFSASDISWPRDLDVNGCKVSDAHPDIINSRPSFTNAECADIAMSFSDQSFDLEGVCLKVLRTWRVIDWCNANAQSPVYFTHIQKIQLKNTIKPVFASGCNNITVDAANSDCSQFVEHRVSATDDCTAAADLKYSWVVDANNNGSDDITGNGASVSRVYPVGTHRMTFKVTDACLNTATCSYTFTIRDIKAPTPVCNSAVTTTINDNKQVEIWASDFNHKSYDLCDSAALTYTFDSLGLTRGRVFTCTDIKNGVSENIRLKVWVADKSNNRDFCEVTLILQDPQNRNVCPNTGNLFANINGKVENKSSVPFNGLDVVMEGLSDNSVLRSITNSTGSFNFNSIPYFNRYLLTPSKSDDALNGVTTLDLVHIQRHILGIKPINDVYDLIASDINGDKKITASDLVALRRIILGIDLEFPNNIAWRFIPTNFEFSNPTQPWDFPTHLELTDIQNDLKNNDFVALKVGDVNNSAIISARAQNAQPRSKIDVQLHINKLNEHLTELSFKSNGNMVSGMQLSLDLGSRNATIEKIESSSLKLDRENVALKNGKLIISASSIQPVKGDELFTITVKGNINAETAVINSDFSEIYNENLDVNKVNIVIESIKTPSNEIHTSPNPFSHSTQITFRSESEGSIKFSIADITGRSIVESDEKITKGQNNIVVTRNQLNNKSGIYFYKFEMDGRKFTGAIILAE